MEVLETLNAPNFVEGLNIALDELVQRDLADNNQDIPITIILKTSGGINWQGQREVNVLTYIGGTDDEILSDLDQN
jgi:hypothetical protein